MGARHRGARRALPAVHGDRGAAARDRLRAARGQRPGQVGVALAALLGRGRDDDHRAGAEPRPHRADARRRRRARPPRRAPRSRSRAPTSSRSTSSSSPATRRRPRSRSPPRVLVPGSRVVVARRGPELDAQRLRAHRRGAWAARIDGELEDDPGDGDPARRAGRATSRSPAGPLHGTVVEPAEVPLAIDELPARRRCSAASPRARRSCAGRRSCASRSPTGSPPWSRGCAASAPTSRRPRTGSPCAGPAACAAARSTPTATTGWRCSARSPGLASREGVDVVGHGGRRRQLPDLRSRCVNSQSRTGSRAGLPHQPARRHLACGTTSAYARTSSRSPTSSGTSSSSRRGSRFTASGRFSLARSATFSPSLLAIVAMVAA